MKKQKHILYNRKYNSIEAGAIHPDQVKHALKELAACLKGLNISYIGMFGTLYLDGVLSSDDILVVNLSLPEEYKLVESDRGNSSYTLES